MKLKLIIICTLFLSINAASADEVISIHLSNSVTPVKIAISEVSKITFETNGFNIITSDIDFFNYSDVKRLTFDEDTNVKSIFSSTTSSVVAPNPAKENLTINGADSMYGSDLYIYSLTGTLISKHANWNGEIINVSHLNAGIYFIKINSTTLKFIKQ